MRAVAAIPAACLLAGSALGLTFSSPPRIVGAALLIVCALFALWGWRRANALCVSVAVVAGFFTGGALLSALAWSDASRPTLRIVFEELAHRERIDAEKAGRRLPEDDEAFALVEGTLRSDAAPAQNGISLSVAVETVLNSLDSSGTTESPSLSQHTVTADSDSLRVGVGIGRRGVHVSGGVQVTVIGALATHRMNEWRGGRRIRLPVQLHRPSRYLDAGVPDFESALATRGTTLVGTVKSGALVELLERGSAIDETMASVRAFARRAIVAAVGPFSPRSAAIVAAIVIGDRAGLDDEVVRRLQEAGTYHVIAISGGNIAILAGVLLAAFRVGGMLGRGAMVAAIVLLIAYARLVGGGASVDRATMMAAVYFGARALDQRSRPLNGLAFTAACLVASQPLSIRDPAFVLTFGATLAILTIAPVVRTWNVPRALGTIVSMLGASMATEAILLPVGAIVFSRVTFAGLALNFAAIPLMAIVQVAGMAIVPAALLSTRAASALGRVADLSAKGLVGSAELVRFAPLVVTRVAAPAVWVVVVYYLAVGLLSLLWRRRTLRTCLAGTVVLAGMWIVAEPWAILAARGDERLHLTFIDVGQGDAAFIRFPRGSTMVVDTGGLTGTSGFDIGDRVVAPVLRASGVRRLDAMVLTHGDPDHIGGAASLIQEFRPRAVWEGIPVPRFEPLRSLQVEARAAGSRWSNVKTGDHVIFDGVDVGVRHPGTADWERQRVRNDDSIVLELRWRDAAVWLTGDIGSAVERTLLLSIAPAPIRIVKVPHHGSLTSSTPEFIAALAPQVAIVSAGRANHFGHPVPEVLDRYRAAGVEVFRTDKEGAVTIDTDGHDLRLHTFTGRSYER